MEISAPSLAIVCATGGKLLAFGCGVIAMLRLRSDGSTDLDL